MKFQFNFDLNGLEPLQLDMDLLYVKVLPQTLEEKTQCPGPLSKFKLLVAILFERLADALICSKLCKCVYNLKKSQIQYHQKLWHVFHLDEESTDIPVKDISKLSSFWGRVKWWISRSHNTKHCISVTYRTYSQHCDYYHYPEIKYIVYYIFGSIGSETKHFSIFCEISKVILLA
jgi:hypothetical protein